MSNKENRHDPPGFDPHETIEHEAMPLEAAEAEGESLVDEGSPGNGAPDVSQTLDGTGLERAARRVLARRGIDVTDVEALSTMESMRAPEGEGRMRDILEASAPVAAAPTAPGGGLGGAPVMMGMRMESIIPDADGDGRERIFETKVYPYSAIAALEITAADGALYVGTGWFVSARTLITAGHCVFVHSPGTAAHGWVRSIRVIPGKNGPGAQGEPFGSALATRFRS
ncbi:trypsin-like serine peptidase, partial [Longimicrobium sp.]|uniref:trypsin-like serine peptidase n=1 Tax=Longimicrobium sp. TaxID=2029185 RepID=UPI002F945F0E